MAYEFQAGVGSLYLTECSCLAEADPNLEICQLKRIPILTFEDLKLTITGEFKTKKVGNNLYNSSAFVSDGEITFEGTVSAFNKYYLAYILGMTEDIDPNTSYPVTVGLDSMIPVVFSKSSTSGTGNEEDIAVNIAGTGGSYIEGSIYVTDDQGNPMAIRCNTLAVDGANDFMESDPSTGEVTWAAPNTFGIGDYTFYFVYRYLENADVKPVQFLNSDYRSECHVVTMLFPEQTECGQQKMYWHFYKGQLENAFEIASTRDFSTTPLRGQILDPLRPDKHIGLVYYD